MKNKIYLSDDQVIEDVTKQLKAYVMSQEASFFDSGPISDELDLRGKKIPFWNVNRIRSRLPEGYFFDVSSASEDKVEFLFGKIELKNKINKTTEIIINEELFCNRPIIVYGFAHNDGKFIVGRRKSSEYLTWGPINRMREKRLGTYEQYFVQNGFESFNLDKEDILQKNTSELASNVNIIAKEMLEKPYMKHELGHVIERDLFFPGTAFEKYIRMSWAHNDVDLECFLRSVSDTFADTVTNGEMKGRYPSIIESPNRDGLLNLTMYSICPPISVPVLKELSTMEAEMIIAAIQYNETKDLGILKEANDQILERGKECVQQMGRTKDYYGLKSLVSKSRKELDSVQPYLKDVLESTSKRY